MRRVLLTMIVILVVTACTASEQVPTDPPEVSVAEVGEVVFDSSGCTYTGPSELPPGKYALVLRDESDWKAQMYVARLVGEYTTQDILEIQGEPGARIGEALWDEAYDVAVEIGAAKERPDGSRVHTYNFISEGEYTVGVWSYQREDIPRTSWFCAPLWIENTATQ
jgi:hypothetical protein